MFNTVLALCAIVLFAGTVIATEVAITALKPFELTVARGFISGFLFFIFITPKIITDFKNNFLPIFITTTTSIYGFQIFLSKAMEYSGSVNSAIALILMPIFTAIVSILIHKSKTNISFWGLSISACVLMVIYTSYRASSYDNNLYSIIYLSFASLSGAISYNFGSQIISKIGVKRFMAIASLSSLIISFVCIFLFPDKVNDISFVAIFKDSSVLVSIIYLSIIIQLLANSLWLNSLSKGNIPLLSQLQLLQTFFTLGLASVFLNYDIKLVDYFATVLLLIHIFYIKKSLQ